MCETCRYIETRITHYRQMKTVIIDRKTLDTLDDLIATSEAQKADLHLGPKALPRTISWPRPH